MRQVRRDESRSACGRPGGGQLRVWIVAVAALGGGLLAVSSLFADIVHLKNGQHVEGEVSEGFDGKVQVTIDESVHFEFQPSEIDRIVRKKSPSARFDERLAKITGADLNAIDDLMELAAWARTRRLHSRVRKAFQRILKIDPHHPEARRGLGYVVHRNRWVHEKDLKGQEGLVQFGDEWMTVDEKQRRLVDRLRRQVREDFRGVVSDNRFIQDYSIRRLLERKDPSLREVLIEFLDHPSAIVRLVAVQALARTYKSAETKAKKGKRKGGARREKRSSVAPTPPNLAGVEARVAAALLKMTLGEKERDVRRALHLALIDVRQREYFVLALKAATQSPLKLHRERTADGVLYDISKPWVPEVIDALRQVPRDPAASQPAEQGNASILRILKRIFPVDLGYQVEEWRDWWTKNQGKYGDEG